MAKKIDNTDVLLSSNIYELDPMLEALCQLVSIKYQSIMAIEDMSLSPIPEGIY